MTPEQQCLAIAEACPNLAGVWSDGTLRWNSSLRPVPTCFDPINDLNAMHEAEKVLTSDQCWVMSRELDAQCGVAGGIGSGGVSEHTWHATARQRAKAFLRAIGKWIEPNQP